MNSYAVGCDRNGLLATACRCYQDVVPTGNNTSQNDAESFALSDTSQSHDEASGIHIQTTEPPLPAITSSENSVCEGKFT